MQRKAGTSNSVIQHRIYATTTKYFHREVRWRSARPSREVDPGLPDEAAMPRRAHSCLRHSRRLGSAVPLRACPDHRRRAWVHAARVGSGCAQVQPRLLQGRCCCRRRAAECPATVGVHMQGHKFRSRTATRPSQRARACQPILHTAARIRDEFMTRSQPTAVGLTVALVYVLALAFLTHVCEARDDRNP
jgi:hypothetical protein